MRAAPTPQAMLEAPASAERPRRPPKLAHKALNGFASSSVPRTSPGKELFAANNLRFALHVLECQGEYFPHPNSLRDLASRERDSSDERLHDLHDAHLQDLKRLYAAHAAEYCQEAMDRYLATDDDGQYWATKDSEGEKEDRYRQLQNFFRDTRRSHNYLTPWSDAVSSTRYAYLRATLPLQAQVVRKDAQFPSNITEFRALRSNMQVRVARFLALGKEETGEHERMMGKWGWAWRQVQPLTQEYEQNSEFKIEIQKKAKEGEVRDPRKQLRNLS